MLNQSFASNNFEVILTHSLHHVHVSLVLCNVFQEMEASKCRCPPAQMNPKLLFWFPLNHGSIRIACIAGSSSRSHWILQRLVAWFLVTMLPADTMPYHDPSVTDKRAFYM